jgi:tripartite-type tricarboxylate transporter receptor subunit TctC
LSSLPDVPTFTEGGLPGISLQTWHGVAAPAGTPKTIIDRISAEIGKLVALPDTKEKLDAQGFVPFYSNPEQTAALLKADIVKYGKIIKAANIKGE